jgi:hypothetical protein
MNRVSVYPTLTIELMRILKRHPDYAQKVGAGVAALGVRSAAYGSQCFEIIRTDDTRTDFSYRVCINGKPSSPLAEAKQAMRAEVNDDIAHAKQQYFAAYGDAEGKVACAVTGEFVTTKTAHVDHAPPWTFNALADTFFELFEIEPDSAFVTAAADNQYVPRIADPEIAQTWRIFHNDRAQLQVVTGAYNLSVNYAGQKKA